jgi:hypothetical protein
VWLSQLFFFLVMIHTCFAFFLALELSPALLGAAPALRERLFTANMGDRRSRVVQAIPW